MLLRGAPKTFVKGSDNNEEAEDDDDDIREVASYPKPPEPPKSLVGMNPFKKRKLEAAGTASSTSSFSADYQQSNPSPPDNSNRPFAKAFSSSR